MKPKLKKSLRKQFISRMLLLLVLISLISGAIQGAILYNKINDDTKQQASMIASTIEHGITETDLASKNIEHQIDLKLELHAKRIGDRLNGRKLEEITSDELKKIRDEAGVTGITIVAPQADDFVNVQSTDPDDIGFSWKAVDQSVVDSYTAILNDEIPEGQVSYSSNGIAILYAAQSGTHTDKPAFFKYGYYHEPGTDFLISPYIEASEVYNFTQAVGTNTWIANMLKENPYAKEIAVLDPRVFADPSLEKVMYPPLKQVVYGGFQLKGDKDTDIVKRMVNKNQVRETYIDKSDGQSVYKMFLPMADGMVIYIALDYKKLSAPLYNYSLILIVSGFISLLALFMLTANFFNKIYRNIQQIIKQIKQLESGDLTAKSSVSGGGELSDLSDSTNTMADTLNRLLTDTHDKATKAQRLSVMLETEANQSVEKAFTMSMETTSTARDAVEEIYYFIDTLEAYLHTQADQPKVQEILSKMQDMRKLVEERTNNTTDITITLSDLFKSLHGQSSELSDLSKSLLQQLAKFKLAG
jgi:hypothetical protein